MSRFEKLKAKFEAAKSTFPCHDLVAILTLMGFEKVEGAGSRVSFNNGEIELKMHKPHPGNEVKAYVVKAVKQTLQQEGLL